MTNITPEHAQALADAVREQQTARQALLDADTRRAAGIDGTDPITKAASDFLDATDRLYHVAEHIKAATR